MSKKLSITYFICIMLLFSLIVSGCSKKAEGTVETSEEKTSEVEEKENSTPESEEVSKAPACEISQAPVSEEVTEAPVSEESNSPWTLLSESSVKTAVFYAGFLNESIGVTVGYKGAISYTDDGGKSWSASDNVSACRYGVDLYDESFIVSSGNSGVNLVSKDKGKSWTQIGDFPLKNGRNYNKLLSVIDTNNIYVGSLISLGVSNDGGLTWKELTLPENCTKLVGMYFLTPETGYLLDAEGTLYKTVDSCKTWTTQTLDLSEENINITPMPSATINFQDENNGMIIYATRTHKHVCIKTEDGGNTWESVEMPKTSGQAPYLSRDGKYLTLSTATKKISLYKLEEK